MEITQQQAIENIESQITRDKCNEHCPSLPQILSWFQRLPLRKQQRLGIIDFRSDNDKRVLTPTNHDRCHTIGRYVSKRLFIWVVKNSDWRPSQETMLRILRRVINYKGNFVINYHYRNLQYYEGEQILIRMLGYNNPSSQKQGKDLLKVLNTIKKRYYQTFFKRCLRYGVSQDAVKLMQIKLKSIYLRLKEYLSTR